MYSFEKAFRRGRPLNIYMIHRGVRFCSEVKFCNFDIVIGRLSAVADCGHCGQCAPTHARDRSRQVGGYLSDPGFAHTVAVPARPRHRRCQGHHCQGRAECEWRKVNMYWRMRWGECHRCASATPAVLAPFFTVCVCSLTHYPLLLSDPIPPCYKLSALEGDVTKAAVSHASAAILQRAAVCRFAPGVCYVFGYLFDLPASRQC